MHIRHVWWDPTTSRAALLTAAVVYACGAGCDATDPDGEIDIVGADDAPLGEAARPRPLETIHYVGRFDLSDPSAPIFEWSGSAIWTRFSGTTITAEIDGAASDFEVEIDGARLPVIAHAGGDQRYVLAAGLARGTHDLKLTRRTEAFFGPSTFRGFTGAKLVATRPPSRLIEVIGDSITCGYGITGAGPGCHFSHDTEAETHAWGALAADRLGAAHHAICWSGIGVFRNFNDEPGMHMPERYGLVTPNENSRPWAFSVTPQVVVINLGTNDFSVGVDPGQNYVDAMTAFVGQVRGHYPSAPIVLTTSPMLGGVQHTTEKAYLETVATRSRHTVVLDLAEQDPADGFGCDFHPSDATAQKMADRLKTKLHALLGW